MSEKRDLFCVRFGFASVSSFICVSVLCLLWITFFLPRNTRKKSGTRNAQNEDTEEDTKHAFLHSSISADLASNRTDLFDGLTACRA